VAPARLAAVGTALAQHAEVPFVAATSGTSNLMATVVCRDDCDLYCYLTERIAGLDGVNAVEAALIIRVAKRAATVLEAGQGAEPARAREPGAKTLPMPNGPAETQIPAPRRSRRLAVQPTDSSR
jgi:hypothetical protein